MSNDRTDGKKRITLARSASAEYEEKRSVFIGHACPIRCEDDARAFIETKKKEYHDARHNCYAYMLDGGVLARYSDDSEPQGTAGIPILNVIKMSGATDMCVVVTRYFGGILLGTGGLVRAYTAAAKAAVDASGFAVFEDYEIYSIDVTYSDYQKISVMLPKLGAVEDSADFTDGVTVHAAVRAGLGDELKRAVAEQTFGKGRVTFERIEERSAPAL